MDGGSFVVAVLLLCAGGLCSARIGGGGREWKRRRDERATVAIAGGGEDGDVKERNFVSLANRELKLLAFDEDYDFNLPPAASNNTPLDVELSINLRNVFEVNEISQLVTVETSVRLYWSDGRVRARNESLYGDGGYLLLNPRLASYLWIPDVFIDQAKQLRAPTFHVQPASIRVYRSGIMRYAARVNFDVACKMDFHRYPGDRQDCDVKFESFGYTNRQLSFRWSDTSHVNENISLAQFDLSVAMESAYDTSYYDVLYPGLIMRLSMRRKLNYHIVQSYIPSGVFLTVSWLALFVPKDSVAERLAMAMTILLTLTTMFASERQNVPRVSYVTYLDVWMLVCILFVFMELAEFTLVLHLARVGRERNATAVEAAARVALPVMFVGFNSVYWYCIW